MRLLLDHEIEILRVLHRINKLGTSRGLPDEQLDDYILLEFDYNLIQTVDMDLVNGYLKEGLDYLMDYLPADRLLVRFPSETGWMSMYICETRDNDTGDPVLGWAFCHSGNPENTLLEGVTVGELSSSDGEYPTEYFVGATFIDGVGAENTPEDNRVLIGIMVSALVKMLQRLKSREYKMCEHSAATRYRSLKGIATPKTYTYISRTIDAMKARMQTDVEWSHCWKVMGHYRRIKGIGKNRRGERCIPNRTWVVEHKKQTHLDYVDKVRIVR